MAPLWQGSYWSQGSVESVDVCGEMSAGIVVGRDSPPVVSCKSPEVVVLGLMSPLLVSSVSPEAVVVNRISPDPVWFNTSAGMVVGVKSPLDVWSKSPDDLGCVTMSPLVVWLMSPEAVTSAFSVVSVIASVLMSPLDVSLTLAY